MRSRAEPGTAGDAHPSGSVSWCQFRGWIPRLGASTSPPNTAGLGVSAERVRYFALESRGSCRQSRRGSTEFDSTGARISTVIMPLSCLPTCARKPKRRASSAGVRPRLSKNCGLKRLGERTGHGRGVRAVWIRVLRVPGGARASSCFLGPARPCLAKSESRMR
jgi:hypothetical protein